MEKLELNLYTVCKTLKDDRVQHGLPFVAVNDDLARKMVVDSLGKEVDKIPDLESFVLCKVARYLPDDARPVRMLKGAPVLVDKVGDLFFREAKVHDVKGGETASE